MSRTISRKTAKQNNHTILTLALPFHHFLEQLRNLLRSFIKAPLDPFVQETEQAVGIEPRFVALGRICPVLRHHHLIKSVIHGGLHIGRINRLHITANFKMKGIKSSRNGSVKSFQNERSATHFKTTVLPKINLQIINNKSVYDCHFKMSVILSLQSVNHSHNKSTRI